MPAKSMPIYSETKQHKLLLDKPSCDNVNSRDDFTHKISSIKNSAAIIENNNHILSPSKKTNSFFKQLKDKLSWKKSTPAPVDVELDNILAQGKALSHDSDTVHQSLNNSRTFTPDSSLSLTAKTGIFLGTALITSAISGGVLYYFQRTDREHYDAPINMTSNDVSLSAEFINSSLDNDYSTAPYSYLSAAQNNFLDSEKRVFNEMKSLSLTLQKEKSNIVNKKNMPPCPPMNSGWKATPSRNHYLYSKNQPAPCLTESFNLRCKKAHVAARIKRGCYNIPSSMALVIKKNLCYCPPPDWLEVKLLNPPLLKKRKKNQNKATPTVKPKHQTTSVTSTIKPQQTTLAIKNHSTALIQEVIYHDNEITKNKLSESAAQYVSSKEKLDTLPCTLPEALKNNTDSVTVSTLDCSHERENLTFKKFLRIMIDKINGPISTVFKEGKFIIQYHNQYKEFLDGTKFSEESKEIELGVDNLLSWIPYYDHARFLTRIYAFALETYSNIYESAEVNINSFLDIKSDIIDFAKDIISSLTREHFDHISEDSSQKKLKDIMQSIKYEKDNFIITLGNNGEKISAHKKLNHFFDQNKKGFLFYDHEKGWVIDSDMRLDDHVKEAMNIANERWKDSNNIYFFKSSSPNIYGNAVIVRYNGNIYSLIDKELHKIDEIPLTKNIFRYLVKDNNNSIPIIFKDEAWAFEEHSSPVISKDVISFLTTHSKIKDRLANNTIAHQDVSPLMPCRETQFDKNLNEYVKINNQYFKLTLLPDTSYYIEGTHDLLALQFIDGKYHIRDSLLDNICCLHKEPIITVENINSKGKFFLDNTITNHLDNMNFLSHEQSVINYKELSLSHDVHLSTIDGAITYNNTDYINYRGNFIKIYSNDDDSYTLGETKIGEDDIVIYKNPWSNTYYKMPLKRNKRQGEIEKTSHCLTKRQLFSICINNYFETERIRHILERNKNQEVIINNHLNTLEPYRYYKNIYQRIGVENALYYKSDNNKFFHVRENEEITSSLIPAVLFIYGKDASHNIDIKNLITQISITKDFDTKKFVFSTLEEARENVFDLNRKASDLLSRWQQDDTVHRKILPSDLTEIAERLSLFNVPPSLHEFFNRSGKKVITSIQHIDFILKDIFENIIQSTGMNELEIRNLQLLDETRTNPVISDICNAAFKRAIKHIENSINAIENSREILDSYITDKLEILNTKARDYFIESMKSKLYRMKLIFDRDNKKNIIIITKKPEAKNIKVLTETGKETTGFTIMNDPLDRIFINTATINNFPEEMTDQVNHENLNVEGFSQPATPTSNSVFFINFIADTMIHEAIHVMGSPEDFLYLGIQKNGLFDDISQSITTISNAIAEKHMPESMLENLFKSYFLSNPLYEGFTLESLTEPEFLRSIFQKDSYFRAIVLLNNPDTISLLIREMSNLIQSAEGSPIHPNK